MIPRYGLQTPSRKQFLPFGVPEALCEYLVPVFCGFGPYFPSSTPSPIRTGRPSTGECLRGPEIEERQDHPSTLHPSIYHQHQHQSSILSSTPEERRRKRKRRKTILLPQPSIQYSIHIKKKKIQNLRIYLLELFYISVCLVSALIRCIGGRTCPS